ncbi:MAG: tetratricopeptide repeat protein, partial [Planctomycetota bacterium]
MAMLDAAVLSVAATRQAGGWLESVEAAIPDESWNERAALAQAWWTLGQRDSFSPYLDRGRQQAKSLAQTPAASAELWYFLGTIGEADGDLGSAEEAYRRAIALNPDTVFARNNLAMVLAEYGGDLNEAVGLAERVIEARPEDPNFHDTLAFVLMQAGRLDEAERAIRVAMELDPSNPAWRVRLEEINARRADGRGAKAE